MAVNKVVYKHFEVKVSPAAAHAVDALLFGCGKINNDLNPDYNADLVNSVAFRASECKITRVVRKNADDESTVLYDGTPVNDFYLEYEPEDENDNGIFSITVKKTDGTDAMKVVTVPYGTNRRPVYATQDEALRARMTQAEDDIDGLETRMTTAENDIDDLEQQVEQAETDIANLEQQVEAIQQKDAEQDEKIEALESTTAGTSEAVGTLQKNYNDLNERVGNIGTMVLDNAQDIAGLEKRFDDSQTFYVKSRQTWTGNVKPEGDPYSIPASVLSLFINIVGSSYSEGETITFEFYANTTDESPAMQIPCRVLSTDISNLNVLVDFAAGTFSIYERGISQTPAMQLTKKLANGFNVMRTYSGGYKKINVKTSATHETPNTMFMIVRSLF